MGAFLAIPIVTEPGRCLVLAGHSPGVIAVRKFRLCQSPARPKWGRVADDFGGGSMAKSIVNGVTRDAEVIGQAVEADQRGSRQAAGPGGGRPC